MQIDASLDLELAWRKTKRDYNHIMNSFVSTPYLSDILDAKQEEWLEDLATRLNDGEYDPLGLRIVEVPKIGFHLRPASALYIEDHVIYSSLLLEIYDDIRSAISWSANTQRYSHVLLEDKSSSNRWQAFERDPWKAMQDVKIELAEEHDYVLITDIAGYYENIEVPTAISTIRQMGGDDEIVFALKDLLEIWAGPRNRGIPQGYGPSDILAEAYLNSIDRRLSDEQITHVRYNDDFVLFTDTFDGAIEAQNMLERLLRERGLNMKSGKTNIHDAETALSWFQEPERSFDDIRSRLEAARRGGGAGAYAHHGSASPSSGDSYGDGEDGLRRPSEEGTEEESADEPRYDSEVLEEAFEQYIQDVPFDDVDTQIFRFIINRLGNVDSSIAVEYCFRYIVDGRPDVRRVLYNYFKDLSEEHEIANRLAGEIINDRLRYPYHEFVITRWFYDRDLHSQTILQAARSILDERDSVLESRDYAVALLSDYGEPADHELIESEYTSELRPMSKAVFAYALRHLEPMRRGGFFERIDSSHHLVEYAIERGRAEA